MDPPRARMIAFYLPQFHPTPENDEWWGRGFTEWTNVSRARPLFEGHYQPHLPANLGYYDLRVPEVREAQASLARRHGLEAFCYWHYWFMGKRLLRRPLDDVLSSRKPAFPFCLAWANESWTRTWTGSKEEVLHAQEYAAEDDLAHIRWLVLAFSDPRYLRVEGRPLFLVYRPADLPSPEGTTEVFRAESVRLGMPEPYLLGVNAFKDIDCRKLGFDGTVHFEPQLDVLRRVERCEVEAYGEEPMVYDYVDARTRMLEAKGSYPSHPSIMVSWDNTPRRGARGIVFVNSTPENFKAGLSELVESVAERPHTERLVFINAWNEWAEGNHLEPDQRNGLGYLEAVLSISRGDDRSSQQPAAVRSAR